MSQVLYLVCLLIGIVFSIMYNHYISMAMVIILAAVPVVSFAMSLVVSQFLKISIQISNKTVYTKEKFHIHIVIHNRSIIPVPYLKLLCHAGYQECRNLRKEKMICMVPAHGQEEYQLTVLGDYAGLYYINIKKIILSDIFGVFRVFLFNRAQSVVKILPNIQFLDVKPIHKPGYSGFDTQEYYENRSGEDKGEVSEIREYRKGDPLHKIHWKLSSKRDKLMVKEYSDPIFVDTIILADLSCYELGINAASCRSLYYEKIVSLSHALINQNEIHYLIWYQNEEIGLVKKLIVEEELIWEAFYEMIKARHLKDRSLFCEKVVCTEEINQYGTIYYIGENKEEFHLRGIETEVIH